LGVNPNNVYLVAIHPSLPLTKRIGEISLLVLPIRVTSSSLAKLRRIQHQKVKVNDLEPIAALSNMTQEHTDILQALTVKKPTLPAQLTLL